MTRRNNSPLEVLLNELALAPWWVSVILAVVAYIGLGIILPSVCSTGDCNIVFQAIASEGLFPLIVAAVLLLPAFISAFKRINSRHLLKHNQDIGSIRQLDWKKFEELLGEYYRQTGYKVLENHGRGPDGGVDLRLRDAGNRSILVQCKQWRERKVGVQIVRELYGVVAAEGASSGIVVTSGAFTKEAQEFAKSESVSVELVDGERLREMIFVLPRDAGRRSGTKLPNTSFETERECPQCGSQLVKKTAKRGHYAGSTFYGCSSFPECRYIEPKKAN